MTIAEKDAEFLHAVLNFAVLNCRCAFRERFPVCGSFCFAPAAQRFLHSTKNVLGIFRECFLGSFLLSRGQEMFQTERFRFDIFRQTSRNVLPHDAMFAGESQFDAGVGLRADERLDAKPDHQAKIMVTDIFRMMNEREGQFAPRFERQFLQRGGEVKSNERRRIGSGKFNKSSGNGF